MDNNTLSITLSPPLKAFVERQVAEGKGTTASEYISKLIGEAQQRAARQNVETCLLEALATDASEMTEKDWADIRREGMQRLASRDTP
jgi:antitoxin ParD1/3/4